MLLEEGKSSFDALDKSLIPNYGVNKGGRGQSIEKLIGLPLGSKLIDFDDGEAKSFKIYAEAYSQDPKFIEFIRSMEAYRKTFSKGTTMVLTPDSEFLRFLKKR